MIAGAVGFVAMTAGSAFAAGGCGGYSAQSVSLETQTASTGETPRQTPIPETENN